MNSKVESTAVAKNSSSKSDTSQSASIPAPEPLTIQPSQAIAPPPTAPPSSQHNPPTSSSVKHEQAHHGK